MTTPLTTRQEIARATRSNSTDGAEISRGEAIRIISAAAREGIGNEELQTLLGEAGLSGARLTRANSAINERDWMTLSRMGFHPGANGDMAPAIREFQRANGLEETGTMNGATRTAMTELIRNAQAILHRDLGTSVGAMGVDGVLGPDTVAAVERFQRAHHLPVTGKLDLDTRRAIFQARDEAPAKPTSGASSGAPSVLRGSIPNATTYEARTEYRTYRDGLSRDAGQAYLRLMSAMPEGGGRTRADFEAFGAAHPEYLTDVRLVIDARYQPLGKPIAQMSTRELILEMDYQRFQRALMGAGLGGGVSTPSSAGRLELSLELAAELERRLPSLTGADRYVAAGECGLAYYAAAEEARQRSTYPDASADDVRRYREMASQLIGKAEAMRDSAVGVAANGGLVGESTVPRGRYGTGSGPVGMYDDLLSGLIRNYRERP